MGISGKDGRLLTATVKHPALKRPRPEGWCPCPIPHRWRSRRTSPPQFYGEEVAKEVLRAGEIQILIRLGDGEGKAVAWGCDLTYDYVKINGSYRT